MNPMSIALCLITTVTGVTAASARDVNDSTVTSSGATPVTAEIWVDNWFQMYVNGQKILEDSTPYKTERSFNAERVSFHADLPMTVAFEFRDFMEDDTGLEYIGSRKQQMGDGGAIAQFMTDGQLIGATGADWRCLVTHHAPVDTACAQSDDPKAGEGACAANITNAPADWTAPDFDDSTWPTATTHSENAVRPKQGYDQIAWHNSADIIWSPDLERDNIILCRATLQ